MQMQSYSDTACSVIYVEVICLTGNSRSFTMMLVADYNKSLDNVKKAFWEMQQSLTEAEVYKTWNMLNITDC